MPLHPNLTSGYVVSILYTETHTFTFQIDFHTQDRCKEKKNIERKIFTLAAKKKNKTKQKNPKKTIAKTF